MDYSVYIYVYIYIYIYDPPLIIIPPNKQTIFVTINLDGGTITPLIQHVFWSNLPRILTIVGFVVDCKHIHLLTTSIRKASQACCLVKPPKIGGVVVDRKSIDL